jgi:hypothetical protein
VSAFGEIKEGTNLEDYDTKYNFFRALGLTSVGLTVGTVLIGGVGYAAYLNLTKNKPHNKKEK